MSSRSCIPDVRGLSEAPWLGVLRSRKTPPPPTQGGGVCVLRGDCRRLWGHQCSQGGRQSASPVPRGYRRHGHKPGGGGDNPSPDPLSYHLPCQPHPATGEDTGVGLLHRGLRRPVGTVTGGGIAPLPHSLLLHFLSPPVTQPEWRRGPVRAGRGALKSRCRAEGTDERVVALVDGAKHRGTINEMSP